MFYKSNKEEHKTKKVGWDINLLQLMQEETLPNKSK